MGLAAGGWKVPVPGLMWATACVKRLASESQVPPTKPVGLVVMVVVVKEHGLVLAQRTIEATLPSLVLELTRRQEQVGY